MIYGLLALLIALQIADMVTTIAILNRPGGRERMPQMRKLMDRFGVLPGMLILKVPFLIAAAVVALIWPHYAFDVLVTLCAVAAGVLVWNMMSLG